ncbi:allatostatin-A receptor [Nematostella vectensis]|nr:allatostatin-A receptor [Nematostella vectensis]
MISVSGNALVVHVVRVTPSMHTSINFYIANMACSDLISTIICVPFSLQSYFSLYKWIPGTIGEVLCKTIICTFYTSFACSTFCLVAIATDRYLAITRPLFRYPNSIVRTVICIIWAVSLALALPISLAYNRKFGFKQDGYCYDSDRDTIYLIGVTVMGIFCYVIPLSIAIALYSIIGWRLRMRAKDAVGANAMNHRRRSRKMSMKASKMMAMVIVVFGLCWAPFFVYHIAKGWYQGRLITIFKWWYRHLSFLLASTNAAINPCLYMTLNQNFRRGFELALNCRPEEPPVAMDNANMGVALNVIETQENI